jgi:UPF0042 nucleotide-binding protein
MQLVVLSGVSGSGKSLALKALEDAGFFCVDNLPAELIEPLAEHALKRGEQKVAIGADARSGESLEQLPDIVARERARGTDVRVIFLDATDESLVRRFGETRRPHPLAEEGRSIAESIARERQLLAWLAEFGQRVDTSGLTPPQLRAWIHDMVVLDASRLALCFQSFGYKSGVPLDADFVFDARFLANPHYEAHLRPKTGRDPEVATFLERETEALLFVEEIEGFLRRWLPKFVRDQRASLNIAIGCTGGRHRSVYVTERLSERFKSEYPIIVRHGDLEAGD